MGTFALKVKIRYALGCMDNQTHSSSSEAPKMAKMHFDPKDVEENKLIAAIAYLWILCFVPLLLKKDSKFAYEHGKQGLVMFIVGLVGMFVFWIPLIGWLLWLAVVILNIVAIIKALQGEFWEIPLFGQLRNKFNL